MPPANADPFELAQSSPSEARPRMTRQDVFDNVPPQADVAVRHAGVTGTLNQAHGACQAHDVAFQALGVGTAHLSNAHRRCDAHSRTTGMLDVAASPPE